jgi:hypothetical protein
MSVGPTTLEEHAQRVLDLLPGADVSRTTEVIQIRHGSDEGFVVLVTTEAIEVRLPTIEWTSGTHGPALTSRLWRRVKARSLGDRELSNLLEQARQARQQEYSVCRFCGDSVPVEHRHDDTCCHGCAERHLGIVH